MRTIAERYELRESLGSGGMAHVYAAMDTVLDRVIALKLLREDIGADPILRQRFLREARLAGSLNHRNIVRVYDAGVDEDVPWMAMELVDGPSLRQRMTEIGPYPAAAALPVMEEVLAALEAAHQANVVHRDIKPANILLGPDGAKLGDFGIAKSLEAASTGADLTQVNQFLGTPKYTAPEVAMGEQATPCSDVYASAVVFWEMLAGHPPFEHANPLSLAMMHRTDPLPSLAAVRPDLAPELVAALEAALAKEPADRPATAVTFAGMLAGTAAPAQAPTQVLPAPALAAAASAAQATRVDLRPPPQPPVRRTPEPASGGSGGWGLAILVALLVGVAVVAFTLVGDGGDPATDPSDGPSVIPFTPPTTSGGTTPAVTATDAPAPAVPTPAATTDPPAPTDPEPTPASTDPPATPTAAEPPPEPSPSAPEPTAAPLIPLPIPGDGGDDDG